MSAIFGIIDFEGRPLQDEWIRSMQTDLAHRGPDGQGLYREESVALGHMLLQVTPESVYDKSPYEEDRFVITANARLDERDAIMDRLGITDEERNRITDPLLLLRSFRKYGKDFVKDIYGDFAFAIWDKEKKELFCARDQMGIKPFLYYFQDDRFVFSTELKALVRLPVIKATIDNFNLIGSIFTDLDPGLTIFKKIIRLRSASTLEICKKSLSVKKYWRPIYKCQSEFKDIETSSNALRNVIAKAVTDRMRVSSPIGIPLSGGMDSTTVACLAAGASINRENSLITVSSVLDKKRCMPNEKDETEYIESVLNKHKNLTPFFIYHSDLKYSEHLRQKYDRYYDMFSPFNYVDEALYQRFKANRVRRVLHGYAGDQTVSNRSIRPLVHLFFKGRIKEFIKLTREINNRYNLSFLGVLRLHFMNPLLTGTVKFLWSSVRKKRNAIDLAEFPLNLTVRQKKSVNQAIIQFWNKNDYYRLNLAEHIWPGYFDFFKEDWDCGSSHYHIEMTYPLVDRRVIECLLRIPVEHFYANGEERGLIKKTMRNLFPAIVAERNEKGYYSPGYTYVVRNGLSNLLEQINGALKSTSETNNLLELFNFRQIKSHLKKIASSGNIINFSAADWRIIQISTWSLFCLWFNTTINENES